MNSLSVVILTRNDEDRIVDTLECVKFADEIVVVDDDSSDRTVELVKQYASRIYIRALNGNFSSQRNFALNHVHKPWVLFIDSDELVSDELRDEIIAKIQANVADALFIKRYDYMWGKKIKYGEVGSVKLIRLAKKDFGKWHGKVHEKWQGQGKVGQLDHPLIHVPHQSVKEFVNEVDHYSTLRADELKESGVTSSAISIIIYPTAKFFVNYIVKRGYKDGLAGLLYAMIMSFHSFLVRSKLYLNS